MSLNSLNIYVPTPRKEKANVSDLTTHYDNGDLNPFKSTSPALLLKKYRRKFAKRDKPTATYITSDRADEMAKQRKYYYNVYDELKNEESLNDINRKPKTSVVDLIRHNSIQDNENDKKDAIFYIENFNSNKPIEDNDLSLQADFSEAMGDNNYVRVRTHRDRFFASGMEDYGNKFCFDRVTPNKSSDGYQSYGKRCTLKGQPLRVSKSTKNDHLWENGKTGSHFFNSLKNYYKGGKPRKTKRSKGSKRTRKN